MGEMSKLYDKNVYEEILKKTLSQLQSFQTARYDTL